MYVRILVPLLALLLSASCSLAQQTEVTTENCSPSVNLPYLSNTKLPDPFKFANGNQVKTVKDWACRKREIQGLLEKYELGPLPGGGTTSATLDGDRLNVTVTDNGKTISFSAIIILPTEGQAPFPAIISLGQHPTIPIPPGVAVIVMPTDMIASQQALFSRGYGLFYDIYGTDHSAGAMVAWTWGIGKLIDALESLTPAVTKINNKRLGATGCSYNAKGALTISALEPRIALTIAQEGGTGGASCWRIAEALSKKGSNVQTARQIVTENVWFGTSFDAFADKTDLLPFDHHMLAGLIAPRGLLLLENTDLTALGPEAQWGCMRAAREVWRALEVGDRVGFSQVGGHRRCQFPEKQRPILEAYISRFLKDEKVNTAFFETDKEGGYVSWVDSEWMDWQTPRLR
ncbi:hypothetical protein EST38_g5210 [Candolleomyces aberdarensis]|uniref:(4-O-methyl)-D-glucuronate--lignin esterase n=1 Tax=Candolleomyces aberdarensis TaxID=2316362 RepID=A0A4Q2DL35_9AGAR|nr:hypothetical protein EST38_g5210 [Candolleomyces aberdarensis]